MTFVTSLFDHSLNSMPGNNKNGKSELMTFDDMVTYTYSPISCRRNEEKDKYSVVVVSLMLERHLRRNIMLLYYFKSLRVNVHS